MNTIKAEKLKNKLDSETNFVLVNVLGRESYEAMHIPGSINIPVNELEERASDQLPDKDQEIIVYCASTSCHASDNAAKKLENMGYNNVVDFEAGIAGWQKKEYELEGTSV